MELVNRKQAEAKYVVHQRCDLFEMRRVKEIPLCRFLALAVTTNTTTSALSELSLTGLAHPTDSLRQQPHLSNEDCTLHSRQRHMHHKQ